MKRHSVKDDSNANGEDLVTIFGELKGKSFIMCASSFELKT